MESVMLIAKLLFRSSGKPCFPRVELVTPTGVLPSLAARLLLVFAGRAAGAQRQNTIVGHDNLVDL